MGPSELPLIEAVGFGGVSIYVLHILDELDLKPEAAGFEVVVYGHSHKPSSESEERRAVFQSGECGSAAVQIASDGWQAGD